MVFNFERALCLQKVFAVFNRLGFFRKANIFELFKAINFS